MRPDPTLMDLLGYGPVGLAKGQAQRLIKFIKFIESIKFWVARPKDLRVLMNLVNLICLWAWPLARPNGPTPIKSIK